MEWLPTCKSLPNPLTCDWTSTSTTRACTITHLVIFASLKFQQPLIRSASLSCSDPSTCIETIPQNISMLMYQALLLYIHNGQYIFYLSIDSNIPLVLCSNFKINIIAKSEIVHFMKNSFNLECASNTLALSSLGHTCLDLTFVKNITAEIPMFHIKLLIP